MINTKALYLVGLLFFGIAAVLTAGELQLGAGWTISLLLAASLGVSEAVKGVGKTVGLISFAIVGLVAPIGYFGFKNDLSFYIGNTIYFVGALYLVARNRPTWKTVAVPPDSSMVLTSEAVEAVKNNNLEAGAVTLAAVASSLSFLWTTYFRYLTSMQDEFIARRLVFTLFLVMIGIALSVIGRSKASLLVGISGVVYLAVGVAKALAYDTTHLTGFLRIGVFAGGGLLLMVGAALMKKKETAS